MTRFKLPCHSYTNEDVNLWYFVYLSSDREVLFDMPDHHDHDPMHGCLEILILIQML